MTLCARPKCTNKFPPWREKKYCSSACKSKMEKSLRFFAVREVETGRTTEHYIEDLYDRKHGEMG